MKDTYCVSPCGDDIGIVIKISFNGHSIPSWALEDHQRYYKNTIEVMNTPGYYGKSPPVLNTRPSPVAHIDAHITLSGNVPRLWALAVGGPSGVGRTK